jgi:hypothetical protein
VDQAELERAAGEAVQMLLAGCDAIVAGLVDAHAMPAEQAPTVRAEWRQVALQTCCARPCPGITPERMAEIAKAAHADYVLHTDPPQGTA